MTSMTSPSESRLCQLAKRACRTATQSANAGREFRLFELPDAERAAAEALLYAALSLHLCARANRKAAPQRMKWKGATWYLAELPGGRLEVAMEAGRRGLVSFPALYDVDRAEVGGLALEVPR